MFVFLFVKYKKNQYKPSAFSFGILTPGEIEVNSRPPPTGTPVGQLLISLCVSDSTSI